MESRALDFIWLLFCTALVFLMQPGFMCLESGLTLAKNSINVAVKNLTDFSISMLAYWVLGFALIFGASRGGVVGTSGWFPVFVVGDPWPAAFFPFQAAFCATASTILSGAVAERMKFAGFILTALLISSVIYPICGHWVWNGALSGIPTGWLGSRGFIDFAGSTVVHSVGGWVALAAVLIVGPREGRFPPNEPPNRITASNLPLSMLGVLLLWVGWIEFNGGSTLTFDGSIPLILMNTTLAAAAASIATLVVGWRIRGLPDVSLLINGSLAGLVGITASCNAVSPSAAVAIGVISGMVMLSVEHLLERLRIDDAVGAIPVHLGGGVCGILAVPLFADPERVGSSLSRLDQFGIQVLGIVAVGVWAFGLTYIVLYAYRRRWPLRVTPEQERLGLNVTTHGARTELLDLLTAMHNQADTGDLDLRVPVEPFTEVGHIAEQYNAVMTSLQRALAKTDTIINTVSERRPSSRRARPSQSISKPCKKLRFSVAVGM